MAQPTPILHATYSSATNPSFAHITELPRLMSNSSMAERINYLCALRRETAILQDRINAELTQRMEDDKAREAPDSTAGKKDTADEVAEEENYGEEIPEED